MLNPLKMEATYRFLDYFSGHRYAIRCEVLDKGTRTTTIKLKEFGPNGRGPGSVMRVHNKSLSIETPKYEPDLSWHKWTD